MTALITVLTMIIICALLIRLKMATIAAEQWKQECERLVTKYNDAADRADRAEVKLHNHLQRERHIGIVYELALDKTQSQLSQTDYNWNWN